jgi:Flp pilus assembly protein TadG
MWINSKSVTERGAAAVEFALIVPILLVLIFGIVEFSRLYNVQLSLTNAAREGARTMAIQNDPALARNSIITSAPSVNPAISAGNISISPAACIAGATVTVTITYTVSSVTGFFGPNFPLSSQGVMRCGG